MFKIYTNHDSCYVITKDGEPYLSISKAANSLENVVKWLIASGVDKSKIEIVKEVEENGTK